MKTCISKVIRVIGRILYLWRTRRKYACEKCRHHGISCVHCTVLASAATVKQLPNVGVPSSWEKKLTIKRKEVKRYDK